MPGSHPPTRKHRQSVQWARWGGEVGRKGDPHGLWGEAHFMHESPRPNFRLPGPTPLSQSILGGMSLTQCLPRADMLLLLLLGVLWGGVWAQGRGSQNGQDVDKRYQLAMESVVTVPQGLCVRVPCSFSYPREGNPKGARVQGYWFREGTEVFRGFPVATTNQSRMVHWKAKRRFQLLGSPPDGDCSLLLKDAQMEDTGTYFFRVEGGTALRYSFQKKKFFLNVTGMELAGMGGSSPSTLLPAPPPHAGKALGQGAFPEAPAPIPAPTQEPAVYVPETLEPGRQATAVCAFQFYSESCPAPTLSWRGAALSPQDIRETTAYVSVLTLTPRRQDHGTDLTCRASFSTKGLSLERSVRLNVACESVGGHPGGQQARWVGRWGHGGPGWFWGRGFHREEGVGS